MAVFLLAELLGRTLRRRHPRRWRLRPGRLALAALAAWLPLALAWGGIGALPPLRDALAAVAPCPDGSLPHRAAVRFVRVLSGLAVVAPASGRLVRVAADGAAVPAGGVLARIVPPDGAAGPAAALARFEAAHAAEIANLQTVGSGLPPAGRAVLRRLRGERAVLLARLRAALQLAPATPVVAAEPGRVRWAVGPGAGPGGWTPQRLQTARSVRAPATGGLVAAGQRLATLTPFASERWAVVGLRPAPPPGTSVRLQPGDLHLRVADVTGRVVWLVGADPAGAAAGRGVAAVTWGRAKGTVAPAAALVTHAGSTWALAEHGRHLAWVAVRVLARDGSRVVLGNLAPGTAIVGRPWLGALWAVPKQPPVTW